MIVSCAKHSFKLLLTSFLCRSFILYFIPTCYAEPISVCVPSGSLVVESVPGRPLGGFQGISPQVSHPGQGPSSSPSGLVLAAPHSTLAQLQMQVDKLNLQARWQPQPPPPPWARYQSVHLQRNVPRPFQGGFPSHSMPPQPSSRFMAPQVSVCFSALCERVHVCLCSCACLTDNLS